MANQILVGKDCSVETVGRKIENNATFEDSINGWKIFATEINLDKKLMSKLTTDLIYEKSPISVVYSEATQYWCRKKRNYAFLEDLCMNLDKAELIDASDALRKQFRLRPVERDLTVRPENYKRVSQFISDNISSLANTTELTPNLKRFVQELEGVPPGEIEFLNSDMHPKTIIGKFYQIFINRPNLYPNLIDLLEDDDQINAVWVLRRFYRKSESD